MSAYYDGQVRCYSKSADGSTKLSTNFTAKEFACNDGADTFFVADGLVEILQKIRTYFGKAVTITSGYRTPSWNTTVGGVSNSQHTYGTAADIVVSGIAPSTVAAYVETLMPSTGGIGIYNSFTHVDVRETKSRWDYR